MTNHDDNFPDPQDFEEPSPPTKPASLVRLAAELDYPAVDDSTQRIYPLMTRLTLDNFSSIEAIADHSRLSRNKVVNQLVDIGLRSLFSELSPYAFNIINSKKHSIKSDLISKSLPLEQGDI